MPYLVSQINQALPGMIGKYGNIAVVEMMAEYPFKQLFKPAGTSLLLR